MTDAMFSEVLDAIEEYFAADFAFNPQQGRDQAGRWGAGGAGGSSPQTADEASAPKKEAAEALRKEASALGDLDDDQVIERHMSPDETREYRESAAELERVDTQLAEVESLDEAGTAKKYLNAQEHERYAGLNSKWEDQNKEVQSLEAQRRALMQNPNAKVGELNQVMTTQGRALEKFETTTDAIVTLADKAEARKEKHAAILARKSAALEPKVEKVRTSLIEQASERHEKKIAELDAKADEMDTDADKIKRSVERQARKMKRKKRPDPFSARVDFAEVNSPVASAVSRDQLELSSIWERMVEALRREVAGWMQSEGVSPKAILRKTERMSLNLDALVDGLTDGALRVYEKAHEQAAHELSRFGRTKTFAAPTNPTDLGNYHGLLRARAFRVAKDMEQKALSAVANGLMNIYRAGVATPEAILQMDRTFSALAAGQLISPGTPGYDYTNPAVKETTIRTVYNSAMNSARTDVFRKNDDFVLGIGRTSVGDSRSTNLSNAVNGFRIPFTHPDWQRFSDAMHYNERCIVTPVTALDVAEPGFEWTSEAEIQRALAIQRRDFPEFV